MRATSLTDELNLVQYKSKVTAKGTLNLVLLLVQVIWTRMTLQTLRITPQRTSKTFIDSLSGLSPFTYNIPRNEGKCSIAQYRQRKSQL